MPAVPLAVGLPLSRGARHDALPLPGLLRTPGGLAMLEIQGDLKFQGSHAVGDEGRIVDVGRLVFRGWSPGEGDEAGAIAEEGAWMKGVELFVGKNQKLVGEVKRLPRPLGVVRRRAAAASGENGEAEMSSGNGHDLGSTTDEYEIADVVRYKLSFTARPEFV